MANRTSRIEILLSIRNMPVVRVINTLRAKDLLKKTMFCSYCNIGMIERNKANHIDGVAWCCYNSKCAKKNTTVSIRKGSFFENFRLSLADIWTIILMWSESVNICDASKRNGIGRKCVKSTYNKLQLLVNNYLQIDPIKLRWTWYYLPD